MTSTVTEKFPPPPQATEVLFFFINDVGLGQGITLLNL